MCPCVCGGGGGGGFSARDPNTPSLILWRKKYFVFNFYSTPIQMSMSYGTYISLRSWVRQPPPPPLRRDVVRAWIYMHMNPVLQESYLRQYYVVLSYVTDYDRESMNEGWVRQLTPPPPPSVRIWLNCCSCIYAFEAQSLKSWLRQCIARELRHVY